MSDNHVIDGMTPEEFIIYNKGYSRGLEIGNFIAEERIIKLLEKHPHSYWFDTRIHTCSACDIIADIKGEQK